MSLADTLRTLRRLPSESGWLKAAFAVTLFAPALAILAAILLGQIFGGEVLSGENARVRADWSTAILFVLAWLPWPGVTKFVVVPILGVLAQALWAARSIELRDPALGVLITGASTMMIGMIACSTLALPLPSFGWSMIALAAVGALSGLVSINFARRSDPPRKGLAYGV